LRGFMPRCRMPTNEKRAAPASGMARAGVEQIAFRASARKLKPKTSRAL